MRSFYLPALAHVAAFLGGSLGWALVVGITAGIAVAMAGGGVPPPTDTWDGRWVGLLSIVQISGFALWALVLTAALPPADSAAAFRWPRTADLRQRLALSHLAPQHLALAFGGSLTVWMLPSWGATRLAEWMGSDGGSLLWIGELLTDGPLLDRGVMTLAVVLSAPVFEELIFRGYLWAVFERLGGPMLALGATTLLFAAYHLDPLHVVTLLPTALFLGWCRWASRSLWPAIAAHFGNNAISVVVVSAQPDALEQGMPLGLGLAGATVTVVCCALAARLSKPTEPA